MKYSEVSSYLNKINDFEKNYDVNSLRVNGSSIWPLFRHFISICYLKKTKNLPNKSKEDKFTGKDKLSNVISFFVSLFLKRKSVLFYGASTHRSTQSGTSFNRYFDPLMDHIEKHGLSPLLFEYFHRGTSENYYKKNRIVSIEHFQPIIRKIYKFFQKIGVVKKLEIENKKLLLTLIEELHADGLSFDVKEFENYLLKIDVWSKFHSLVFKILKPQAVFVLSYYDPCIYGVCLAGNKNKIKVIDMQHGAQGAIHVDYASFTKVPENGYSYLPKVFWCWDKGSGNSISSWVKHQRFHEVHVGGNPWFNFSFSLSKKNETEVIQNFKGLKPLILCTLQVIEPLVEDYVLEVISKTNKTYKWWLRTHPRSNEELLTSLKKKLESLGVSDSVYLEYKNHLPLPVLLRNSELHISKFSGSVIEASLMGVFSIVLGELGANSFDIDISKVIFIKENDVDMLEKTIPEKIKTKFSVEDSIDPLEVMNELLK